MASKQFASPIDASERVLADGRVIVPGTPVDLDDESQKSAHNQRLIAERQLIEVKTQKSSKSGGEK